MKLLLTRTKEPQAASSETLVYEALFVARWLQSRFE
jgi:hypothetical protein